MENVSKTVDNNMDKLIILKCLLISLMILLGARNSYFNIFALITASYFIFRSSLNSIIGILMFTLSFSPIFKLSSNGYTLFNVLVLVAILKLIFLKRHIFIHYKAIIFLLAFSFYVIAFGGLNSIKILINLLIYFVLLMLIFSQKESIDLHKILFYFSLGIILSSVSGMLIDYIPGLSAFLRDVKVKLNSGEGFNRFSGIQWNPNFYTMDISMALSGLVSLAVSKRTSILEYLAIVILSILGLMSISKSFLVILVLLFLLILIIYAKQNIINIFKGIIGVLIFALLVYALTDKYYINAFLGRMSEDYNTYSSLSSITSGRYDIWNEYLNYIFNNAKVLFFGAGVGAKQLSTATHNYVIEAVYYLGIMGTLLYLLCIKAIFPHLENNAKHVLANYIPLIILSVRAMAINLMFRENLFFYFIIIAVVLNTELRLKHKKE